jgi:hypothetical protein
MKAQRSAFLCVLMSWNVEPIWRGERLVRGQFLPSPISPLRSSGWLGRNQVIIIDRQLISYPTPLVTAGRKWKWKESSRQSKRKDKWRKLNLI